MLGDFVFFGFSFPFLVSTVPWRWRFAASPRLCRLPSYNGIPLRLVILELGGET